MLFSRPPCRVKYNIYRGSGRGWRNIWRSDSYVSEVGPGGSPDISPVTEMVLVSIRPALPQPKGTTFIPRGLIIPLTI